MVPMICLRSDGLLGLESDQCRDECIYLNGNWDGYSQLLGSRENLRPLDFFLLSPNNFVPHQRDRVPRDSFSLPRMVLRHISMDRCPGRFLFVATNGFAPHQRSVDSSITLQLFMLSFFLFIHYKYIHKFGSTSVDLCFSVSCFIPFFFADQGFAPVCTEDGEKVTPMPASYFDVLSLLGLSLCEQFMETLR